MKTKLRLEINLIRTSCSKEDYKSDSYIKGVTVLETAIHSLLRSPTKIEYSIVTPYKDKIKFKKGKKKIILKLPNTYYNISNSKTLNPRLISYFDCKYLLEESLPLKKSFLIDNINNLEYQEVLSFSEFKSKFKNSVSKKGDEKFKEVMNKIERFFIPEFDLIWIKIKIKDN